MEKKSELLKKLIEYNCIHNKKDIKLSAGSNTNIYYDIKKAIGIPDLFSFITLQLNNIIPQNCTIVAVSTGGIPYASALSFMSKQNLAYVRENKKNYGMNNIIEGVIDHNKTIYILDDVCTTGKSIVSAESNVRKYITTKYNTNPEIKLVCIVDRQYHNLNIMSLLKAPK